MIDALLVLLVVDLVGAGLALGTELALQRRDVRRALPPPPDPPPLAVARYVRR